MKHPRTLLASVTALTATCLWALSTGNTTGATPTAARTDVLPVACRLVDDRPGTNAATTTKPTSIINQRQVRLVEAWDEGTGQVTRTACNIPGTATAMYVRVAARRTFDTGGPSWLEAGFCTTGKPGSSKMAAVPVGREFRVVSGWVVLAPLYAGETTQGATRYDRQFCVWSAAPNTQVFIDVEAVLVPG